MIRGYVVHHIFNSKKVQAQDRHTNQTQVGRNKTTHVQWYTEIMNTSEALTSKHKSHMDHDEMDEDRREQRRRHALEKTFKKFCKETMNIVKAHNASLGPDSEVDVVRNGAEYGFTGVPFKEMVTIQPTLHALVSVVDTPFFVVGLSNIEHIHLERVDFGRGKNFDMVIILKAHMKLDSTKSPQRVTAIDINKLEAIKEWVDSIPGLTLTMGVSSLQWKAVMDGVRDELEGGIFWKDVDDQGVKKHVGWSFLGGVDADDEEGFEG